MVKHSENEHQPPQEVRFRISVNLERFYKDERMRAFVSVEPRRRVRALRRRLRQLFGLPRHFSLLCRGHLLPPDEPLSLLQPDDIVQAVPMQHDGDYDAAMSTDCDLVDSADPAANALSIQRKGSRDQSPAPPSAISPDRTDNMTTAKSVPVMSHACDSPVAVVCSEAGGRSSSPASSVECHMNNTDELRESKLRALSLLEQLTAEASAGQQPLQRARRRRVRRRRRALSAAPASPPAPGSVPAPYTGVVRVCVSGRAPRVVHSLPDTHTHSQPHTPTAIA